MTDFGVDTLVVVTGAHHDLIATAVGADCPGVPVSFARNPDPDRGQLSSLWVGMDLAVRPETEALLVTLVDVPLISADIVGQVVGAWRTSGAPIVRPAIGDLHGHPVLYDRSLFAELRAAPLNKGAKYVVRAHEAAILNVAVTDPGCLRDVDTPDDYRELIAPLRQSS